MEITRIGAVGPTVDRPNLATFFGVLVLVLGRGFHILVQLVPMATGAAVGAGLARGRRGPPRPRGLHAVLRWGRRGSPPPSSSRCSHWAWCSPARARPHRSWARTGAPVPGSVAELATVRLGGHDQTVLIRGRNATAPVLLYLAGGPGQSDLGYAAPT